MVPDVMELKAMQELRFEAQSSFKLQVFEQMTFFVAFDC